MRTLLRELPRARWLLAASILFGVLGGLTSAKLIALVNSSLHATELGWSSVAMGLAWLAIIVVLSRAVSQLAFTHLSQASLAYLRSRLTQWFSAASLRQLERYSLSRGMAALTEDTATAAHFFVSVPLIVLNGATVIIYHRVLPNLRASDKAVLVISHDDRFFHLAGRVVRLDAGLIAHQEDRRLFACQGSAGPVGRVETASSQGSEFKSPSAGRLATQTSTA